MLAAALAPAAVFAALGGSVRLLTLGFLVALAHAVLLGLPFYLLLRMKGWVNAASTAIGGFFIGVVPAGVVSLPLESANVEGLLAFGGLGLLGGLAFWATLRVTRQPSRLRAPSLVVVPVLAAATLAVPLLTKDRSCHNLLRDGRSTISAALRVDVRIEYQEWPALAALLREFAASHALSFRDSSKDTPDVVRTLYLSACDDGVNIEVADQRWAHSGYSRPLGDRGVSLGVYAQRNDIDWQRLAKPLVEALEKRWPGRVEKKGTPN